MEEQEHISRSKSFTVSSPAMAGSHTLQREMHNHAQPHYPSPPTLGRPRNSSAASRYTPDGYPVPPRPDNTESMAYLAPENQQPPPAQSGGPFIPSRPEQYAAPPAALSGAVPPAQLPPWYQDDRHRASDGYDRPDNRHRRSSVASHHSGRSRRSSHSHRHHDSDRHNHHDSDRHSLHEHSDDHDRHKKTRHSDDLDEDDKHLKRKNTPSRSYGGSLFALFDVVKDALKGN